MDARQSAAHEIRHVPLAVKSSEDPEPVEIRRDRTGEIVLLVLTL